MEPTSSLLHDPEHRDCVRRTYRSSFCYYTSRNAPHPLLTPRHAHATYSQQASSTRLPTGLDIQSFVPACPENKRETHPSTSNLGKPRSTSRRPPLRVSPRTTSHLRFINQTLSCLELGPEDRQLWPPRLTRLPPRRGLSPHKNSTSSSTAMAQPVPPTASPNPLSPQRTSSSSYPI